MNAGSKAFDGHTFYMYMLFHFGITFNKEKNICYQTKKGGNPTFL